MTDQELTSISTVKRVPSIWPTIVALRDVCIIDEQTHSFAREFATGALTESSTPAWESRPLQGRRCRLCRCRRAVTADDTAVVAYG